MARVQVRMSEHSRQREIICITQSDLGEQVIIMRFLHIGLKQIRQIPQRMEMPETEVLRIL